MSAPVDARVRVPAVLESRGIVAAAIVDVLRSGRQALGLPPCEITSGIDEVRPGPGEFVGVDVFGKRLSLVASDLTSAVASAAPDLLASLDADPRAVAGPRGAVVLADLDDGGLYAVTRHLAQAAVETSPGTLVRPGDADSVRRQGSSAEGADSNEDVLRELVRRGGDPSWLGGLGAAGARRAADDPLDVESLLDELGAARLEVRATGQQVRELTVLLEPGRPIPALRDAFRAQFGPGVPPLEFVVDDSVPTGQMRLSLGPVAAPPTPVPRAGEQFVFGPFDAVVPGRPAVHPDGTAGVLTDVDPGDEAPGGRLSVGAAELVLDQVFNFLENRVERLVTPRSVVAMCDAAALTHAALVREVRRCVPEHEMSRQLARLVRRTKGASPLAFLDGLGDWATGWHPEPVHAVLRRRAAAHTLALTGFRCDDVAAGLSALILDPPLARRVATLRGAGRVVDEDVADDLVAAYLRATERDRTLPLVVDDDVHAAVQTLIRTRVRSAVVLSRIDVPARTKVAEVGVVSEGSL